MPRRRTVAVAAAVLLLVSTGACADDDGDVAGEPTATTTSEAGGTGSTSTSAGGATTTTASVPTPTEPTRELSSSDDTGRSELEDGRHFGYWKTFEVRSDTASGEFDLAYFLDGDAAEKAAKDRGEEVPLPNDYYIVNDNPKLRTLVVRRTAKVTVLAGAGGGPDSEPSTVADFASKRHEEAGFWVTIADGIVTEIEEQYQP